MFIQNSSGLLVQIVEPTPVVPAGSFGNPSWPQGSGGGIAVSAKLNQAVDTSSGSGNFDIGTRVLGTRGSILVSFISGLQGQARTIGYLTDNQALRIVVGLDALNRPDLSIYDASGVLRAQVIPTYRGIPAGSQGSILVSWDSTRAIDGTRHALLHVNASAIPAQDWVTNPTAIWTSLQPTNVVLGFGVSPALTFNGSILAFQISNDVVPGGPGSSGQFPSTRVFDRFLSDAVAATTT